MINGYYRLQREAITQFINKQSQYKPKSHCTYQYSCKAKADFGMMFGYDKCEQCETGGKNKYYQWV